MNEKARDQDEGGAVRSPQSVQADSGGGSQLLHIELGLGRSAVAILWISSLISGLALAGLVATCFFIYKNIGYTAVLEYDLMDLRAKVGAAHENTPVIDPDEAE